MIGIDAVDVERLRAVIQRSPAIEDRLFTRAESAYCRALADPVLHLAGTLAVKEAVIKAAGLGPLTVWGRRIQVQRDRSGAPRVEVAGMKERRFAISISHDGPVAVAVALSTRLTRVVATNDSSDAHSPKPNLQLMRYLSPVQRAAPVEGSGLSDVAVSFAGTDFP